ncbi:MAG: iron-sulfur cluster assembly scaffold protein [Sphingorhabdus sp.]|uniref:iron-sulfur cluster assembly scaffold protein n=1 Tax=Sphingorhabdus sp. TaxID=1902408 RepID=UPI003C7F5C6A
MAKRAAMSADLAARPIPPKPQLYTKDILRLAASLPFGDRLEGAHASATRRSPVCGSEISADVQLDDSGQVAALAFRAHACAIGQASAALLRQIGPGASVGEIEGMRTALAKALSGDGNFEQCRQELAVLETARAYPARHAAILLPYDAVLAAVAEME